MSFDVLYSLIFDIEDDLNMKTNIIIKNIFQILLLNWPFLKPEWEVPTLQWSVVQISILFKYKSNNICFGVSQKLQVPIESLKDYMYLCSRYS